MPLTEYPMWVDGHEVSTAEPLTVRIPFNSEPYATVFAATPTELELAVQAARRAARVMRDLTRDQRSTILRRASARLLELKEDFAQHHQLGERQAHPRRPHRSRARRLHAALFLRGSPPPAGEVVPIDASPVGKGRMAMTVREPLGVIAAITPFNVPLNLAMHKIGPALAAGNAWSTSPPAPRRSARCASPA